jgi:hypothetical protein
MPNHGQAAHRRAGARGHGASAGGPPRRGGPCSTTGCAPMGRSSPTGTGRACPWGGDGEQATLQSMVTTLRWRREGRRTRLWVAALRGHGGSPAVHAHGAPAVTRHAVTALHQPGGGRSRATKATHGSVAGWNDAREASADAPCPSGHALEGSGHGPGSPGPAHVACLHCRVRTGSWPCAARTRETAVGSMCDRETIYATTTPRLINA